MQVSFVPPLHARLSREASQSPVGEKGDLVYLSPRNQKTNVFSRTTSVNPRIRVRSYALPLTYAYDALDRVTSDGSLGGRGTADVLVTCGVILLALALGAATLRRRTA
jgi:ABC-2 type transport system permease protein